ncbi:MAG: GNAT family N-acetyltransferase [Chitinophagaceae bacterium]|nr:GNAT family N-acetyltransferase [Chitinophagaceae bacterium]
MSLELRRIKESDDQVLAGIIRQTLAEFGANHKGTVYDDPSTDQLSRIFTAEGSLYYVAELNGKIVGGGGLFPTDGLPPATCEFVKMYLLPEARGLGIGRALIEKNLEKARELGYVQVYLESMPELKTALSLYEKFGWVYLNGPLGNSGHTGCSRWMLRPVNLPTLPPHTQD